MKNMNSKFSQDVVSCRLNATAQACHPERSAVRRVVEGSLATSSWNVVTGSSAFLAAFLVALLLTSCSDDSATDNAVQTIPSNMDVVAEIGDLPACKKSNEGELVWIKGESAARVCVDGKWYATKDNAECETQSLSDKSGVKIVCGGDSVGVVLNGENGSNGKNGTDGKDGKNGTDGKNGENGVNGKDGTNGKDGVNGTNGKDGQNGVDGKDGKNGADGRDGVDGVNGKDGVDGKDGTNGRDGVDGKDGVNGKDGENGKDGRDGIDGKDGTNGRDGIDGKDGTNGRDGVDGKDGSDGKDGVNGKDGRDGIDGKDGTNGRDGVDGKDGTNGRDGVDGKDGASCTAVTLADNSGLKILCGGDSVGVVYNGRNGVDGKDGRDGVDGKDGTNGRDGVDGKDGTNGRDGIDGKDGTNGRDGVDGKDGTNGTDGAKGDGCAILSKDCILHVACGKDTVSLDLYSTEDACREIVEIDSEKVAISLNELSGVTQKGPFLSGSKVLVREMEDGRTLTQTGNSFNGKILNDNGEFKINARMLVSQYVMLEASGYYRNEVTGENSNSELTLFAITDVNERNTVNVNLLTHLEYERVIYLVTQKKMKVKDAKKQAQKEVFGLLNIDATNFSNSEDLNIAGASDEDAALLAFSIILQGDRSVSQLSELLTKIAIDMEKDGTWDDASKRSALADFAAKIDSSNRIQKIRANVENWKLSSLVPNFEKHVRRFWTKEFGMGECKDANFGEVVAANKGVATRRYICRKDSLWHVATDYEKDTYLWNDTTDGAIKAGNITKRKYVFDSTGIASGKKGWREAAYLEGLYGGCSKPLYDAYRCNSQYGGCYQCQKTAHNWVLVNNTLLVDTQLWKDGEDGFAKLGDSIGVVTNESRICYVFDTSTTYNGWRIGNENDCSLGLMGCTAGRASRMLRSSVDGEYYNCANNTWTKVIDRVRINTEGWACLDSNDGEMKIGLVNNAYFVCEDDAWREATNIEEIDCRDNGICRLNKCTE